MNQGTIFHHLRQSVCWGDALFVHIEHYFADTYLRACHATLKRLDWQKEVLGFQRGAEVDRHAVYLLERLGGIVALDVLRRLTLADPLSKLLKY